MALIKIDGKKIEKANLKLSLNQQLTARTAHKYVHITARY